MEQGINPVSIFLPVLAIVALTFVAFVRMAVARSAAAKGGHDPNFYRAQQGAPEPEATVVAVRHYGNLFELPVLFYAACITAFVLRDVGCWTLGLAWAYVAARLVQSAVHLSYNEPVHRGLAFVVGLLCVFALWGTMAAGIFLRL